MCCRAVRRRSQEFTEAYAYWKVLGRSADADGKKHFAEIASGTSEQPWALSIAQVVDELLSSEEFASESAHVLAVCDRFA